MNTLRPPSTPVAVTVLVDRARVTRAARVSVDAGPAVVEFADLPLALIGDSLRARGRGTARAALLGVTARVENFAETPAEAARALEARLQAFQDEDADLASRAATLTQEQAALKDLAAQAEMFARGIALRNRTADEQTQVYAALFKRQGEIAAALLGLQRDRRELKKRIDQVTADLNQVRMQRPRQRHVAAVELDVREPGELDLELTYMVTGAGWTPLYDLRHADDALSLGYLAQVQQRTGEDWPDVQLTLSTAQPQLSLAVPELAPWFVMPKPPPQAQPMPKMARSMAMPAPMMAMAADAVPAPAGAPVEEMAAPQAAVGEAGASLTYTLAGRARVPGNGEPRKVSVAVAGLKPQVDYITAPKLEPVCYRRATVRNTSDYTLLPGEAQLFDGDAYLGATHLELTAPGQEIELVLGSDERVKVERELTGRQVDKTLLSGNRRVRFGYAITLENARSQAITVIVRDQMPVSRDEQIKVKLETADPKPAEIDKLNVIEWRIALPAGGKHTLRFEFTVEHPQAMDVVGLP